MRPSRRAPSVRAAMAMVALAARAGRSPRRCARPPRGGAGHSRRSARRHRRELRRRPGRAVRCRGGARRGRRSCRGGRGPKSAALSGARRRAVPAAGAPARRAGAPLARAGALSCRGARRPGGYVRCAAGRARRLDDRHAHHAQRRRGCRSWPAGLCGAPGGGGRAARAPPSWSGPCVPPRDP